MFIIRPCHILWAGAHYSLLLRAMLKAASISAKSGFLFTTVILSESCRCSNIHKLFSWKAAWDIEKGENSELKIYWYVKQIVYIWVNAPLSPYLTLFALTLILHSHFDSFAKNMKIFPKASESGSVRKWPKIGSSSLNHRKLRPSKGLSPKSITPWWYSIVLSKRFASEMA